VVVRGCRVVRQTAQRTLATRSLVRQLVSVGSVLSGHHPITEVVFSHPVTHHPSQKIMEGIFLCLGCRSPNVAVVTYGLRLIMVKFLCQSPQRIPILAFRMCNFKAHASIASVRCLALPRRPATAPAVFVQMDSTNPS